MDPSEHLRKGGQQVGRKIVISAGHSVNIFLQANSVIFKGEKPLARCGRYISADGNIGLCKKTKQLSLSHDGGIRNGRLEFLQEIIFTFGGYSITVCGAESQTFTAVDGKPVILFDKISYCRIV